MKVQLEKSDKAIIITRYKIKSCLIYNFCILYSEKGLLWPEFLPICCDSISSINIYSSYVTIIKQEKLDLSFLIDYIMINVICMICSNV